ncbi:2-dehydro-3-deoxy-6-phosphogalactonate aldolase [Brooklawnia cerclae]|uniref:2-dehydro-3-deoxyphosphogalactonate aldolase n=1 Tax=Brooklawnia cerclae TaxID=349934 RepID=A0ABX0SHA8_9ACTN|nr:2-dehydro-3-deoxy-6-phosphogalactonate aldolase [Brooklawnia cerclae]NIH57785.1 2-dehydro-3-deoxyphosphogalactonate aldolase [Brooklawnia cerclae]
MADQLGLIAILRGITPAEATKIADAIVAAGISTLEVPLNSPDPFTSISRLRERLGSSAVVGAGTVLSVEDVRKCHEADAQIVVAPTIDTEVVTAALELGMTPIPGVATATEAFQAYRAGARQLKIFPANVLGVATMKAWRDVLPRDVSLLPVGGVDASTIGTWAVNGADGAGIGGALYRPGRGADVVGQRAHDLVAAWTGKRTM